MTLHTTSLSLRSGYRRLMTLLLLLVLSTTSASLNEAYYSVDDINYLFGPNGCIEGTLSSMPSAVLAPAAPVPPQQIYDHTMVMTDTKTDEENGIPENVTLANTKEKTPMCLVNELARYNKIPHQYRLTNEQGPAHRKQFTVTLMLGTEEYTAEGASIKKAQHQAANIALTETNYEHPPPKPLRSIRLGKSDVTPTVELNAWAMKRGEMATYHFIAPSNPHLAAQGHNPNVGPPAVAPPQGVGPAVGPAIGPNGPIGPFMHPVGPAFSNFTPYTGFRRPFNQLQIRNPSEFHRRNMYRPHFSHYEGNQRYYNKGPVMTGVAPALFAVMVKVGSREFTGEGATAQLAKHAAAARALSEIRQLPIPDDKICYQMENGALSKEDSEIKSPISLVHEVALRRNLPVKFEVINVTGPPHMRSFHTLCTVGEFKTEGIGNGKKISKKRASDKMLEELKRLPPESPCISSSSNLRMKRKPSQKKKPRKIIKDPKPVSSQTEQPTAPPEKEEMNPISRLIQIQQAKREPDPVYSLVEERGAPRRREFIMSVKIDDKVITGSGPNKKLAKRAAAESMLQELGYSRPKSSNGKENRKVVETSSVGGTSGRQLVPGLLLMSEKTYSPPTKASGFNSQTASIAKEFLQSGKTVMDMSQQSSQHNSIVRPKDQLLYLANILNFKVQFSDFPKGNHREFLSLVSLSTSPPQVCHGAGFTTEASHDQAALTALRMLEEMGLDMFSTNKPESPPGPGGDGGQVSPQVFNVVKGSTIYEDPKNL